MQQQLRTAVFGAVIICGAFASPVSAQWGSTPRHLPQRPGHQPNQGDIGVQIFDSVIKGIDRGIRDQQQRELRERNWNSNNNNNNWNNRRNDGWYEYDDEPRYPSRPNRNYAPQTVRPNVTVKPNVVAKPNVAVKKNAPPKVKPAKIALKPNSLIVAKPANAALINSTSDQIAAATEKKIDNLKEELAKIDPALANDPDVAAALAEIKTKNATGAPVTQDDFDKLRKALGNAVGNLPMPLSVDGQGKLVMAVEQSSGAIVEMSSLQTQLQTSTAGVGWILYNPAVPPDTVLILPSGAVMAGGGGYDTLTLQQGSMSQALGLPVSSEPPLPDAPTPDGVAVDATGEVVLYNSTESACHYVLNNQYSYTMEPGREQRLAADQKWTIKFDRGNGSEAEYSLPAGDYRFAMKDGGWDLVPRMNELTIDNSDNPNAFEYVVDNENYVVEGSGKREHRSAAPMSVRFDRGGNGETAEKQVAGETTLRVAVDSKDQLWNLYPVAELDLSAFK